MNPQELRDQIALRLDRGWSLGAVERTLIDPATELGEDDRDAMWLFAWSYLRGKRDPEQTPKAIAQ